MPEYEDVPQLIADFKRAAIDAYMRTQTYAWEIDGDKYEINSSGAHYTVTRPGEDGEGGGDWSSDNFIANIFTGGSKDDEWGSAFDAIRSRIDSAIEPWLTLPEPTEFESFVEECRQVTRGLSGAPAATSGGQTGAGVIPGNLALIVENSTAMSGAAIAAFKSNFLAQLGPVVGGLHGISLVLGSALAAEQGLWDAARRSVASVVEASKNAAAALAEAGSSGSMSAVLDVAGWAVKGAKAFLPGAGAVLEITSLGIEILDGGSQESTSKSISGADAEAVLASFELALSELNNSIRSEETQLKQNLTTNLANVRADRTSYDLTVSGVRDDPDVSNDVIMIEPSLIEEISKVYLPRVASELTSISSGVLSSSMTPAGRDGSLGIGSSGPAAQWSEMRTLLYELTKNLSWDVTQGATNLDLLLQDMQSNEQRIADEVSALLARLDAGNPTDPWN